MSKYDKRKTSKTIKDPYKSQRQVAFFLRLHGHLPDENCGDPIPFGYCYYRPDLEPINAANQPVEELRQNPDYRQKEQEVEEAVKNGTIYPTHTTKEGE